MRKQLGVVGLIVLFGFLSAGVGAWVNAAPPPTTGAAEKPAAAPVGVKWEYATLGIISNEYYFASPGKVVTAMSLKLLKLELGVKEEGGFVDLLTAIGAQGWELVAVNRVRPGDLIPECYFKRLAK